MSIIFIRVIVCCSEVSFVCHVTCCIVMFCCFPLLTVGDILLPEFLIVSICSSTGVVLSWVLTVESTLFSMVLTIQATMLVAFSRVLTVLATQFFMVLTVQATMLLVFSQVLTVWATLLSMVLLFKPPLFFSSFMGVNCLSHPIFYGANFSSHHVLSFFTGVNCLSHPVFSMVRTVQATMFLAFSRVLTVWATQYFLWCELFKPPCS